MVPAESSNNASPLPAALRWLGPFLAGGYAVGLRLHRALAHPQTAPLPVICAGNLTAGGTGKTPAVKYLARGLASRGFKPAVLMRGYKEQARDEAAETTAALEAFGVPVLLGSDRLASSQVAKARSCDVVLLDDGFQHWRLKRDLDIVLVDATNPFGGGHLLPWGWLRERPQGLSRAGAVLVTRADAASGPDLAALEKRLRELAPRAVLATARHAPAGLRLCGKDNATLPLGELRGAPVIAACGVGNPRGFLRTLQLLGAEVRGFNAFSDHHAYTLAEVAKLAEEARARKARAVVTTEKDAPKIAPLLSADMPPVWVLSVQFELLTGEAELWRAIENVLKTDTVGMASR